MVHRHDASLVFRDLVHTTRPCRSFYGREPTPLSAGKSHGLSKACRCLQTDRGGPVGGHHAVPCHRAKAITPFPEDHDGLALQDVSQFRVAPFATPDRAFQEIDFRPRFAKPSALSRKAAAGLGFMARLMGAVQPARTEPSEPPGPSVERLAQRSVFATIWCLTGFQGLWRCETILHC